TFVLLLGCHLTRSCRAFSFPAHYHGFCPQQREVVWNLLLQDGSEGPPLIDYSVTQKRRLSPPLLLMAHSKAELHCQLNLPHRRIVKQARDDARACGADRRAWARKLGPVESIKHLDFELMFEALLEASILHNRKVRLKDTRRSQNVSSGIAPVSGIVGRRLERSQVEPVIRRGTRERSRGDAIRPVASAGRQQSLLLRYGERQPRLHRDNAVDLPSGDQRVREGTQTSCEEPPFAERQFINSARGPGVFDVEVGQPSILVEIPGV